MTNLGDVIRELTKLLNEMQIAYAVMGGIAVRAYALPRPTFDVDFTLAISESRLPELFDRCEAIGFTVPPQYRTGWVDRIAGMPLVKAPLFLQGQGIDVDMFLVETPYQHEVIARRRMDDADGHSIWLVSPEDLILLKLIASRPRDLLDVGDVLFMQGQLDVEYLRRWAQKLGIKAQLEKSLADHAARETE
jgi:hypothetical protein